MVQNALVLRFMDIKDYFNAFYCVVYKYMYLSMLVIMELYGIFLHIIEIIMKKLIQKPIRNDKMVQIDEIIMKYQLEKTSMALFIRNQMILCELLLNIAWEYMVLANVIYYVIFISK